MLHDRTRGEDGASLIFVLIFVTVFGLILAGLLTESTASIKFTQAVATQESKVYAADAGVSIGIQEIRQNNELCPDPGAPPRTIPISTTINGMTVDVTCAGTIGSALGVSGFAVMVLNSTSGVEGVLHTQNGAGEEKDIQGPVFVEGDVDLQANLTLKRGRFYHKNPGCDPTTLPANLTIGDAALGYSYMCTDQAQLPPSHTPPTVTLPIANSNPTAVAGCKTFLPGVYSTAPVLATDNYFVSGVYYFNFPGTFDVLDNQYVFGGKQGDGEDRSLDDAALSLQGHSVPACAKGGDPAGYYGSGVKFIFGQTSGLNVDYGQIELFARQDDAAHDGASGTNGTSVVALPNEPAWSSWAAAQVPLGAHDPSAVSTHIIEEKHLPDTGVAIHGLVYARDQYVMLGVKGDGIAQSQGGIVANYVDLVSIPGANGMAVTVQAGHPVPRHVKVTGTVTVAGNKPVESTAIIELPNGFDTPAVVESWRTRGIPDIT